MRTPRPGLLLLSLPLLVGMLSGCLDGKADTAGEFAYFNWGQSQRSCVSGICSYGSNGYTDSARVTCGPDPTLSWDAKDWIHGSVRLQVLAPNGTEAAEHTVSSNGKGSMVVEGPAGIWTLTGTTRNANGNMQGRLACSA